MKRNLSTLIDGVVRATDGDIGTVAQFYFDDLTWKIRYIGVTMGGRPSDKIMLISSAALGQPDWDKRIFPVNLTLSQAQSGPSVDMHEPISRLHEVELHEYYAWPAYWDGSFYVSPGFGMDLSPLIDSETAEKISSSVVRKADPHLHSVREIMSCRVHATDGNMGHVEDTLIDDESWVMSYLVVNTRNLLPKRRVLVSPQWIRNVSWADKKVFADLSRAAIKNSPIYNPLKPLSLDYEVELHDHLRKLKGAEWVVFKFHAPSGAKIYVAGTFTNWNPTAIPLGEIKKGTYSATIMLPLGRYEYKFVVDGIWQNGPAVCEQVPNVYGTMNNVLIVSHHADHEGHLHTFSSHISNTHSLLWTTPVGG